MGKTGMLGFVVFRISVGMKWACTFRGKRIDKADPTEIVEFARRRLRFEPDEKQVEILRADSKRVLLACSRQWGKSTVAGVKAIHRAWTQRGSLTLIASPGKRQSAEFLRKTGELMSRMGLRPKGDGDNELSILFPNGSRIVGLPGVHATVRGFSAVSLIMIDEAGLVKDEMYRALRPMLATTAGDVWLMSTPVGKRGFFYEAWAYGGDTWTRLAVKGPECERIDRKFLEEELVEHGAESFRQEYLCEFVDDGEGLFDRDVVERAVRGKVETLEL